MFRFIGCFPAAAVTIIFPDPKLSLIALYRSFPQFSETADGIQIISAPSVVAQFTPATRELSVMLPLSLQTFPTKSSTRSPATMEISPAALVPRPVISDCASDPSTKERKALTFFAKLVWQTCNPESKIATRSLVSTFEVKLRNFVQFHEVVISLVTNSESLASKMSGCGSTSEEESNRNCSTFRNDAIASLVSLYAHCNTIDLNTRSTLSGISSHKPMCKVFRLAGTTETFSSDWKSFELRSLSGR
mmetsp:Transcript_6970/g.8661  ORF Transcript_6970/g.8661 Transcript_6970/m.8661 type:complete len:247 (-) Transcript_6970:506-1246(-)